MENTISISQKLLDDILSHCKETYPEEACGLLAGKTYSVERVYRIRNINNSNVTHEMDPKEQLRSEKDMREKGLKLIVIYHSHPSSSAYPSQTDVAGVYWPGDPDMQLYPGVCHMIVGPVDGNIEVKVFKIDSAQQITEVEMRVT